MPKPFSPKFSSGKLQRFFLLIVFAVFILTVTNTSKASSMNNEEYRIQEGRVRSASQETLRNQSKIILAEKGEETQFHTGTNYKLRYGFKHIDSITPFTFSISSTHINFGALNPGEPITRTGLLTVLNAASPGYKITAEETGDLATLEGATIPDTTCDTGTCTERLASVWDSPLTYGFGYRCDDILGFGCVRDFSEGNLYKQFANRQNNEPPETIMSGSRIDGKIQTQITYRVNIPATQIQGHYQNTIIYIAIPSI